MSVAHTEISDVIKNGTVPKNRFFTLVSKAIESTNMQNADMSLKVLDLDFD